MVLPICLFVNSICENTFGIYCDINSLCQNYKNIMEFNSKKTERLRLNAIDRSKFNGALLFPLGNTEELFWTLNFYKMSVTSLNSSVTAIHMKIVPYTQAAILSVRSYCADGLLLFFIYTTPFIFITY